VKGGKDRECKGKGGGLPDIANTPRRGVNEKKGTNRLYTRGRRRGRGGRESGGEERANQFLDLEGAL